MHTGKFLLILLVISLAGCSQAFPKIVPIAKATETPAPTQTVTSTAVPTLTPEPTQDPYVIDKTKLSNFPESYEYVVAHPDEFVRAPDIFTERAAFDKWWNEQFIPALGPVSERSIEIMGGPAYDSTTFSAGGDLVTGKPTGFFYFLDGGELRPVVVENIGNLLGSSFIVTMAVILFDPGNWYSGLEQIQPLSEGHAILHLTILTSAEYDIEANGYLPGFEFVERVLKAGFKGDFDANRVAFGAGFVLMTGDNQ